MMDEKRKEEQEEKIKEGETRLRIAILECDTPLEQTRAKYGGYGGVFTALLEAAAASLTVSSPRPLSSEASEEEENSTGVVGSRGSAREVKTAREEEEEEKPGQQQLQEGGGRGEGRGERKVPRLEITKWDVVHEQRYPNLDDVDGVLLTGSRMSINFFLSISLNPSTFPLNLESIYLLHHGETHSVSLAGTLFAML